MKDEATTRPPDLTSLVVRALVLYSLAEFQGGHATTIRVDVDGNTFSVADDGRGHAIHRVVSGQPYLPFIYTHFDYPFTDTSVGETGQVQVQLQGIGMSLLNSLCSALSVVVRKRDGTLRLRYESARLSHEAREELANDTTGTAVSGAINPLLRSAPTDSEHVQRWLRRIAAAHPTLTLLFNGSDLSAPEAITS